MGSKTKQPNGRGATMGSALAASYSPSGGVFGLSPPEVSPRDGRKKRLYFRCSYSEDKHCMASKLMQQVSYDDPPLYKVTYMYEHTCNAAPIPAPDIVADQAELLPTASNGLVLSFGSCYGVSDHRDARMRQEQRPQYHQPMSWSSCCELPSFGSWNSQLQQQPAALSSDDVRPPAAGLSSSSSSSSFPTTAESSLPTLPVTNYNEGDVLSTWNYSCSYGVDEDHIHFNNDVNFAGNFCLWRRLWCRLLRRQPA